MRYEKNVTEMTKEFGIVDLPAGRGTFLCSGVLGKQNSLAILNTQFPHSVVVEKFSMKFMKLGSKPDAFYSTETARSVSSEVSRDLIVQVKGSRYLVHKFPLLSKCLRLRDLCAEIPQSSPHHIVQLPDFPGGAEAFELCAKFCYDMTITLSAYNIVAARCAAEYLQMTEDVERGNLIFKIEVFFNSCILQGLRDSILTLVSTRMFPMWSQDLEITSRCIDSIVSKVLSHSYTRRARDDLSCSGSESIKTDRPKSKGWWAEDIAELGIDHYWRTMIAIKSGGKVPSNLIGDALRIYASKWLPDISKYRNLEKPGSEDESDAAEQKASKYRFLLESIVSLLPAERDSVSCRFLSKLLKAGNILQASQSLKLELAKRIAVQLEDATVGDLLIPMSASSDGTKYDIDTVMTILEQFMSQGQSPPTSPLRIKRDIEHRRSRSAENVNFELQESRRSSSASHSSKLKVAKLVDGYLQEIAHDDNLSLLKFLSIAEAVPAFSRIYHDDLYKSIDIYLKEHPGLSKSERNRLCKILDCKKLSMEACIHAAQNEFLPLRVLVQVLFYEHAKSSGQVADLPSQIKALLASQDDTSRNDEALKLSKSKLSTLKMRLAEDDLDNFPYPNGVQKPSKINAFHMIPDRPKRLFRRLWSKNNGNDQKK